MNRQEALDAVNQVFDKRNVKNFIMFFDTFEEDSPFGIFAYNHDIHKDTAEDLSLLAFHYAVNFSFPKAEPLDLFFGNGEKASWEELTLEKALQLLKSESALPQESVIY